MRTFGTKSLGTIAWSYGLYDPEQDIPYGISLDIIAANPDIDWRKLSEFKEIGFTSFEDLVGNLPQSIIVDHNTQLLLPCPNVPPPVDFRAIEGVPATMSEGAASAVATLTTIAKQIPEAAGRLDIQGGSGSTNANFANVSSSGPPGGVCYVRSYGRGAGSIPDACPPNTERNGELCYPRCGPGYYGVGPVCWQTCPSTHTVRDGDGEPGERGRHMCGAIFACPPLTRCMQMC